MTINYRFEELPGFEDFRGRVIVEAEGAKDVLRVAKHFRLFDSNDEAGVIGLAGVIGQGRLTHTLESGKRPWFEINGSLDHSFITPYLDLLAKTTGYDGCLPREADLTAAFGERRLCHTFLTQRLWIEQGEICFQCYEQAEEWNKKSAAVNAENHVNDYMSEEFGFRPCESEFIHNHNGTFSKNPNYLKRHAPKPSVKAEWFWAWLWDWWLDNHATDAQRDLMRRATELSAGLYAGTEKKPFPHGAPWSLRSNGSSAGLVDYAGFYLQDDAGTVNWDGKGTKVKHVDWKEFAAAK